MDTGSDAVRRYCFQRARTFFESVAAIGSDLKVHPYLAESITPNAEFTEWTITVRDGITFTDGTPLNADAVIKNLQVTGTGLLISAALLDVAKVPSVADPTKQELKIEKVDDMTFTIFTGLDGDPAAPMPWPGFDVYLTAQWGLIASPTWLDGVAAGTADPLVPIGTGPFVVESFAPRDKLVVKKNPELLAEGRQRQRSFPTSTESSSGSSRTPRPPPMRCARARSTSSRHRQLVWSPTSVSRPASSR